MTIKGLIKTIEKREWHFVAIIGFLLIIITSLPYLYGYLNKPANSYFLGTSLINWPDYQNYFSWIEQAKQGNWLFKNLYTSEPQKRIFFNLFFLFLGWLAKIFNLSPLAIFQISRIFLIPIFLIVAYLFVSYFLEREKRKFCFILLLFSSGLGVFASGFSKVFFGKFIYFPDFWLPEAITFLTLYLNPLHILSLTLILLIFLFILIALEEKRIKYAFLAGFTFLFLAQIHPYNIPTIIGLLFLYLVFLSLRKKEVFWTGFGYYFILIFISLPSLFYWFLFSRFDQLTIDRVSRANEVSFTPPIFHIIILYGINFFLALIGVYFLFKNWLKISDKHLFLITWLGGQFFLIYSSLPFQRRMIEGLQIGIVILATIGIFFLYELVKKKYPPQIIQNFERLLKNKIFLTSLFIPLFFLSNLAVLGSDIYFYSSKSFTSNLSQDKINAFKWLKENSDEDKVILSSYYIGSLIPRFTTRISYLGHGGSETVYFLRKEKEVEIFFKDNKNDSEKFQFLKDRGIDYIFFSEEEKKLGEFNPEEKDYLKKVFNNKEVAIYQINH